jgi:DNA polymerase III epsilon subunit-like protein
MKPIYSRTHPGRFILVLDCETTGSTFGAYEETFSKFQAIQFGAIVATSDTFEEVASLEFKVKFNPKYEWSKEAEAIHGITQEDLQRNGLIEEEAAAELAGFLLDHFGPNKIMFAGHNPWFDIAAMEQLLVPHGVMPQLHHVVLDTSALGFITCGKFRSSDLFEFFLGGRAEKHGALDDARMTLAVLAAVRQLMNDSLSALQA